MIEDVHDWGLRGEVDRKVSTVPIRIRDEDVKDYNPR
jgi:hypothetical protein